jgi:hypothetical protein
MHLAESRFACSPSPVCHPKANQQGDHQEPDQRDTEQHLEQRESSRISPHSFSWQDSGGRKLEIRNRTGKKMETGRGYEFPVSSFQFPVSNFQFPISSFQFLISSFGPPES